MARHPLPSSALFEQAIRSWWSINQDGQLQVLLDQVPLSSLPQLDEHLRRVFWYGPPVLPVFTPDWMSRAGQKLLPGSPAMLCVLACHPNGHVREAAVLRLADVNTPLSTGLLLVRLNDWVEPLRRQASIILLSRLRETELLHWLLNFPLVTRLIQDVRAPNLELYLEVLALLDTPDGQRGFQEVFSSLEPAARLMLALQVLSTEGPPQAEVVKLFAQDTLPAVRLAALEHLPLGALTPFLADPVAAVRASSLRRLVPALGPEQALQVLSQALLDSREQVRLIAQFGLQQRGQEVRPLYLLHDPATLTDLRLQGWIAGLGTAGTAQDTALIRPFLHHPRTRVRLEVLHALGRLDARGSRSELAAGMLASGPIYRVALRALKQSQQVDPALLNQLWTQADTLRLQRRVLPLALELGRFGAADLLLSWRETAGAEVATLIDQHLIDLLSGYGRTHYTRPPAALLNRLAATVQHLPRAEADRLQAVLAELRG